MMSIKFWWSKSLINSFMKNMIIYMNINNLIKIDSMQSNMIENFDLSIKSFN